MRKKKVEKKFANMDVGENKLKLSPEYNLTDLYAKAYEELSLQQSKRDQIISLYLAVFSFLIPFSLSLETLSWRNKGWIFIAVGIIGILFSFIIVRYRVYKEVYWMCCQSISTLYNFKQEELDKKRYKRYFIK